MPKKKNKVTIFKPLPRHTPNPTEEKRVLVACEESQEVTKAFRAKGDEAYSCDLLDCSGGHPDWHIKGHIE